MGSTGLIKQGCCLSEAYLLPETSSNSLLQTPIHQLPHLVILGAVPNDPAALAVLDQRAPHLQLAQRALQGGGVGR